jgi:hypothetical protein
MKLPDDIFNQEILQYKTLDNIVKLETDGVVLLGDIRYWIYNHLYVLS